MPYRDSPYHGIEILMSFDYLKLCKPNEHTEDYHIIKANDKTFIFRVKDNEYV